MEMDSYTEMRSYDSGKGNSIPLVVYEGPVDSTLKIVSQLKNISTDIDQIKTSLHTMDELHQQVDLLSDSMGHLVRQINTLREVTQKSLKEMSRDLQTLRTNQAPIQCDGVSSTTGSMKRIKTLNKGQRPSSKQQWSHDAHIEEALQENIVSFVDHMAFRNTPLPDRLIENDCLSEDECSVIRDKHDKDQIRHLVHKLMVRGPEKIVKFLDVLRDNDYGFLTDKVHTSLNRLKEERKDVKLDCIVCHVKKNVDLRDVSDYLFNVKMIKRETYGDIIESRTSYGSREFIWSRIINDVNKSDNFERAIGHIKEAVSGKYDYLVKFLTATQTKVLQCSCGLKRRRRQKKSFTSGVGSQTDLSTTSEIPKYKKVGSNDLNSEADSTSVLSSLDLEASYGNLTPYTQLTERQDDSNKNEPDSTTYEDKPTDIDEPDTTLDKRSRHNTGEFNTEQEIDEIMEGFKRQQSTLYVDVANSDSITQSPESTTRPALQKSISQNSTLTVRPANSTESSGDTQYLTDGSGTQSALSQSQKTETPINDKTIDIFVEGSKVEPDMTFEKHGYSQDQNSNEALEETTNHGGIVKKANRFRRFMKLSERLQDGDSSFADGEGDGSFFRRRKTSKNGTYCKPRNASYLITKSKSRTGLIHATPQGERRVCMKKKTRQRKERRERHLQKLEHDNLENETFHDHNVKISHNPYQKTLPYNPSWPTHVQTPRTSSWDYNQARRHWLMSHKLADAERKKKKLDSDLSWTEGSDTFG